MGMSEHTKGEIIATWLKDANVSTIVVEDIGTAKEISEKAINDGLCCATLWVYVTEKYDIKLFYKDIARQLFARPITEEWEYEDKKTVLNLKKEEYIQWGHTDEKTDQEEEMTEEKLKKEEYIQWGHTDEKTDQKEEMTEEKLKERIQGKLQKIRNTNKYLLLVLDVVGKDLISMVDLQVELSQLFPSKFQTIIITTKFADHNANQTSEVIKFLPSLQLEELLQLLRKRVDKTAVSDHQRFQRLDRTIAEKSKGEPAAIIVIAETLNYIAQANASELESAISRAALDEKTSEGVNPLIYCACDMIKNSVTRNCFWHSMQLFRNYGGLHYNELICHWIMEGYLDPFDRIEKAYRKGHGVLVELIGRALLIILDNNIVVVERAVLKMIKYSCPLTATLRLFKVLKDDVSLGRVTRMNGMIKTLCNPKSWEKNSTLLIDGSHIRREVHHQSSFNSMKELKVLAVFKARCDQSLISSLSMDKLLVLVLRGCDLLDFTAYIKELKKLKVLEISGRDSKLSSFPDILFNGMTDLQSLNLSELQIKSLPSLSNLRELRSLVLRQLSCLEEVQSLKELVKLEILDLSGACSLKSMPSDLFDEITNLESINLSGLKQIESLPLFSKLRELRVLILSRCSSLKKLQSLGGLDKLELLDISDATSFESFDDSTLPKLPKIQKIDLSNTNIRSLPGFDENKELTRIFLSGRRNFRTLETLQHLTSQQINS